MGRFWEPHFNGRLGRSGFGMGFGFVGKNVNVRVWKHMTTLAPVNHEEPVSSESSRVTANMRDIH